MLNIKHTIHPFRLVLSRKEPIQLEVSIRNPGPETEMVSYEVKLARALSFDKGGLKTSVTKRVGDMEPRAEIKEYFEIHARQFIKAGTYPGIIIATEHYKNYSLAKKDYKQKIELIVQD